MFLTLQNVVSKYADYSSIIKMGVTELVFSYNLSKVKLTVETVAMVTCYFEKTAITCSPMFKHLLSIIIAV